MLGGANDTVNGFAGNDRIEGGAGHDSLNGGADNDDIIGGSGNDTLIGGLGNDNLYGQGGHDLYLFTGEFGQDRMINAGDMYDNDTIRFDDLTKDDLWFSRVPGSYDLLISVAGSNDSLLVREWFSHIINRTVSQIEVGSERILANDVNALAAFMEETSFNVDAIENGIPTDIQALLENHLSNLWQQPSPFDSDDIIEGDVNNNSLNGFAGNDQINGLSGNDIIDGGQGHDRLSGHDGNDQINGGSGNDLSLIHI